MTTLDGLLNNILSKARCKNLVINRDKKIGDTGDHELEYNIIYKKEDGYITIETARIYVFNMGEPTESANWLGSAPAFITGKVAAKFEAILATKIASIKAENPLILRLIVSELYEENSCAIVKAFIADSEDTKHIIKEIFFVWNDGQTLKHAPYEG